MPAGCAPALSSERISPKASVRCHGDSQGNLRRVGGDGGGAESRWGWGGVAEVQGGLQRCPSVPPSHLPYQTYTLGQSTSSPDAHNPACS